MARLKIPASNFQLVSKYSCTCHRDEFYDAATDAPIMAAKEHSSGGAADRVTHTVRFDYAEQIPSGATIVSAKVYATLDSSTYGAAYSTVNGVHAEMGQNAVDVTLADGGSFVGVPFVFESNNPAHEHSFDDAEGWERITRWNSDYTEYIFTYTWYVEHEGVRNYTDVYLLIEYTPAFTPPELLPYTDPRPVAGETYARAVHMTELHANANLVREAYGLPVYDFLAIAAMGSLLARWNANVIEIRAALDAIGVAHEEWLVLGDNRPRLDVLLQLRRVVAVLAAGEDDPNAVGERFFTTDGELLTTADGLYFRVLEGTANG